MPMSGQPCVSKKVARSALASQSTNEPMKPTKLISMIEITAVSTAMTISQGSTGRE